MKRCTSFEVQKGTRYIRRDVYFAIIVFSCLSSTKAGLRFILICFARDIKDFYQSSLENKVDFRDIMNVLPNIFTKNLNFKKQKLGFVDERALITATLISSCHLKILVPFYLQKIFNTNSELSQNHTKKQFMPSKTTLNWLFNDI